MKTTTSNQSLPVALDAMASMSEYPFEVRPLSATEGGGFLIRYTDFKDCVSDGDTLEETLANGRAALADTVAALVSMGLPVPAANQGGVASGKFLARVPKTLHAQLVLRARSEGVSLNTLVLTFLAQSVGIQHTAYA